MHNRKVLSQHQTNIRCINRKFSWNVFLNQEHMYDDKAQTETGEFSLSSKKHINCINRELKSKIGQQKDS